MNFFRFFFSRIGFANSGLKYFFSNEKNGQLQLVAGVIVTALGFYFDITKTEWCIVLLLIGLVLSFEMVNTAVEVICNHVTPDIHPKIKIIKDVCAGAVWWFSIIAMIIGLLIFYPYFKTLIT